MCRQSLLLMTVFFTTVVVCAPAFGAWHFDQAYVHQEPELLPGMPIWVDETVGHSFLALYDRPGLWLARCSDADCVSEPVDAGAFSVRPAYLFTDDLGLYALYYDHASDETMVARPGDDGWTIAPFVLPQECAQLVSATLQPNGELGLLCLNAADALYHFYQQDGEWSWDQLDWYSDDVTLSGQSLTYTADGVPHIAATFHTETMLFVNHLYQDGGWWDTETITSWLIHPFSLPAEPSIVANQNDELLVACYPHLYTLPVAWVRQGGDWSQVEWSYYDKSNKDLDRAMLGSVGVDDNGALFFSTAYRYYENWPKDFIVYFHGCSVYADGEKDCLFSEVLQNPYPGYEYPWSDVQAAPHDSSRMLAAGGGTKTCLRCSSITTAIRST